jgi:hypothetical protein
VPRFAVVPDRSRIDLAARPDLPGVRLAIDDVSGWIDPDGRTGELTVSLRAVPTGDLAQGVPAWLAGGEPVTVVVAVALGAGACREDRVEVSVRFTVDGRTVGLTGTGRIERDPGAEGVRAAGLTVIDPRVLGFALPPLVGHPVQARWVLHLVPVG